MGIPRSRSPPKAWDSLCLLTPWLLPETLCDSDEGHEARGVPGRQGQGGAGEAELLYNSLPPGRDHTTAETGPREEWQDGGDQMN